MERIALDFLSPEILGYHFYLCSTCLIIVPNLGRYIAKRTQTNMKTAFMLKTGSLPGQLRPRIIEHNWLLSIKATRGKTVTSWKKRKPLAATVIGSQDSKLLRRFWNKMNTKNILHCQHSAHKLLKNVRFWWSYLHPRYKTLQEGSWCRKHSQLWHK